MIPFFVCACPGPVLCRLVSIDFVCFNSKFIFLLSEKLSSCHSLCCEGGASFDSSVAKWRVNKQMKLRKQNKYCFDVDGGADERTILSGDCFSVGGRWFGRFFCLARGEMNTGWLAQNYNIISNLLLCYSFGRQIMRWLGSVWRLSRLSSDIQIKMSLIVRGFGLHLLTKYLDYWVQKWAVRINSQSLTSQVILEVKLISASLTNHPQHNWFHPLKIEAIIPNLFSLLYLSLQKHRRSITVKSADEWHEI